MNMYIIDSAGRWCYVRDVVNVNFPRDNSDRSVPPDAHSGFLESVTIRWEMGVLAIKVFRKCVGSLRFPESLTNTHLNSCL
jgi:hypothetical protein